MTELTKEGSGENMGTFPVIPKRKQGKQFTVNGSKKSNRISSYGNLKNTAKLTRIRSVDSMGNNNGVNDEERPNIARTRSNAEVIRSVSSGASIYNRPLKAKSMTNLHLKKTKKNRMVTDGDYDSQTDENPDDKGKNINEKDDFEDYEEDEDEDRDEKGEEDKDNDATAGTIESIISSEKKSGTADIPLNIDTVNADNSQASEDPAMTEITESVKEMKVQDPSQGTSNQQLKNAPSSIKKSPGEKTAFGDEPNAFQEGENSLNMYRMQSVLSQSTGQERQLSNTRIATMKRQQTNESNEKSQGTERKGTPENVSGTNDSNATADSSKSDMSYHNNQDSLIFQQSGLTLYNLTTQPSAKNLQLSQVNASNVNKATSHQSLQRQESYLSFKVPENRHLHMSMIKGDPQHQYKDNMVSTSDIPQRPKSSASEKEISGNISKEKSNLDESTPQPVSLLSKQAKSMEYGGTKQDNSQSEILNLDLSSYLSSQEPEIESRTQQKLWLQRENVATLNDFEEGTSQTPSQIVNQTSRFQYEQLSREFLHIRRHTNPMLGSLQRVHFTQSAQSLPNSKKLDVPEPTKSVSKSISKSSLRNSRPTTANSISQSLGLSLKDVELTEGPFAEDLESYNDVLLSLWQKSCLHFKESGTPSLKSSSNSSSSYNQGGVSLSARYGYQPNTSVQQFPQAFARGNHTSFGNRNINNNMNAGSNGFGNQVSHFGGVNRSSQYQPTTRAQQQQQQQEQQRRYQLQQSQQ